MIFNRLFGAAKPAPVERSVYELIVAQARQPWFYAQLGVPDTVSGRFDMIVMHMFLVLERLSQGNDSDKAFSQALFDEMNRDMDRSLREMGASDVSVGKKVRKMAEVFYGRANAYREALAKPASADEAALVEALQRNLYAEEDSSEGATPLAHYIRRAQVVIAEVALDEISGGYREIPRCRVCQMTEMSEQTPVLSRLIEVEKIPSKGTRMRVEANPDERQQLALLLSLSKIHILKADVEITPWRKQGVKVAGVVKAHLEQKCVVTLEDFDSHVEESFERFYLRGNAPGHSGKIITIDPMEDDVPEQIDGNTIDAGVLITESLSLALDPYPKKPGAVFEQSEPQLGDAAAPNPFAALKNIKDADRD